MYLKSEGVAERTYLRTTHGIALLVGPKRGRWRDQQHICVYKQRLLAMFSLVINQIVTCIHFQHERQ
jgi:hypothetical protein